MQEEIVVDKEVNVEEVGAVNPIPRSGSWAAKLGVDSGYAPTKRPSEPAAKVVVDKKEVKPVTSIPKPASQPVSPAKKNDFGGKGMSPEFADWCRQNMTRLKGNEDLTLLQFCLTLSSAGEIREYLATYLGSTPQVVIYS